MKWIVYPISVLLFLISLSFFAFLAINATYVSASRYDSGKQLIGDRDTPTRIITEEDLKGMPRTVKTWIRKSGIIGSEFPRTMRLSQKARIRNSSDANWMELDAEQYIRIDRPEFIWLAAVPVIPGIHIIAKDSLIGGKGRMKVNLSSFITISDTAGEEVDQGSMLRYLAEIVWYPYAGIMPFIQWEIVDATHTRAILTYEGQSVQGVFSFNDDGFPDRFVAERFREMDGKFQQQTWEIKIDDYRQSNGLTVPHSGEAFWLPENAPGFSYFQGNIREFDKNYRLN